MELPCRFSPFKSLSPLVNMVSTLTDDIFVEILNKLPLKTLSRLKSVSKAWHRLISEDCIRDRHPLLISAIFYHPNTSHPRFGTVSGTTFTESTLADFPFSASSTLVDCSNGLLLFVTGNTFLVCHPVTNRWALLPVPPKRALISVLAFDPYRAPHYRVVSFTGWEAGGAHLEVFSSESDKWVEWEIHWDGLNNDDISANMSYFDGALHILAYPMYMVRVDLELMVCKKVELPAPVSHMARVGTMGGRVSYACSSSEGGGERVWVFENDKWMLKHRVKVECEFNLLGFDPEREVIYVWAERRVIGYDMGKEMVEQEWEMRGEMEGANMKRIWVLPLSRYLLDCMIKLE